MKITFFKARAAGGVAPTASTELEAETCELKRRQAGEQRLNQARQKADDGTGTDTEADIGTDTGTNTATDASTNTGIDTEADIGTDGCSSECSP